MPSAAPTPEGCPVANQVGHEGAWVNLTDIPIEITAIDPEKYVAFRLKQTIVPGSAYYLSVMYECVCVRFYNASTDEIYPELIGECHDGEATVSIFVQDPTLVDNGEVDIPEQCAPMHSYPPSVSRVAYHFALPCGRPCPDDNQPSDGIPTDSPKSLSDVSAVCEDTVVVFEDFESGNDGSWEHGIVSNTPVLSSFLGRLGRENDYVRKTFVVPQNAESVTVEFLLYEIDNWMRCDKLTVLIGNKRLDLKQFYTEDFDENPNNIEEGRKGGIMWSRHSVVPSRNIAFNNQFKDQIHKVEMTIPANYFSGELEFALKVTMNDGVDDASAGIDNLRVTAHGVCAPERELKDEEDKESEKDVSTDVASEPQYDGDDGGPYCSSEDFPCGGENNVYICHYNPHLGYQTFCVPEEESDIVKFYANSYCGPCVGGFGGKWH
jgi:hypothetical protein